MAVLNAAARKKIPKEKFGLPEKDGYPMEDKAHAIAAKSRAAANATPAEEKRIDAKANRVIKAAGGHPAPVKAAGGMTSVGGVPKGPGPAKQGPINKGTLDSMKKSLSFK